MVLNDKILIAPAINALITGRQIMIGGEERPFWEKTPWLQKAFKNSYIASSRQGMVYVVFPAVISIAVVIFVLMPRIRRRYRPSQE